MPQKADKELKKFRKVVDLLRQLYKDEGMKILVAPDGVELKIEEDALEKYVKKIDLLLNEAKELIRDEISRFLNATMGNYEEIPWDMLLGPLKKGTEKAREMERKTLEKKMEILKETELEWSIRRRSKAKLRAKVPVLAETRWEICRKLGDERKSKRDSVPFAMIEFRYLKPPFSPTGEYFAKAFFGVSHFQETLSLWCDKEDIHYLIAELEKIEKELTSLKGKVDK